MSLHAPLSALPLFRDPEPEEVAKDAAMTGLEERNARWLGRLRDEMRKLYEMRVQSQGLTGHVTADDARRLMEHRPELRPPAGTSNNVLGALFRAPGWEMIGFTKSTTTGSHGNRIGKWAWTGAER